MPTFGDTWREVRLHVPDAPFGLVRSWTQAAYEDLCERRPWNWTRKSAQLVIPLARSITATFTLNSTTVTSAALFTSADVGRQIRVGTGPIYTIHTVTDTSTLTIDQAYTASPAGAQTAQILGLYQTLPADFGAFLLIVDLTNQRQIPWWHTQEDLARIDPTRSSSDGTPRALVSQGLSTVPATLGQVRYEWWPAPLSYRAYPYYYRQAAQNLADTDLLQGVLAGSKVLLHGALARCALWPGTTERKNPYFNNVTYRLLKDDFEKDCAHLELRDDDTNFETWVALPYHRWAAYGLGGDTEFLRETDATLADYR